MARFDKDWIENRYKTRKGMNGLAMRQDGPTGYLESVIRRGFSAKTKKEFIGLLAVCSNQIQICRRLGVDVQSMYDAIALDKKFREDFLRCLEVVGRKKQLTNIEETLAQDEKQHIVNSLANKINDYK